MIGNQAGVSSMPTVMKNLAAENTESIKIT